MAEIKLYKAKIKGLEVLGISLLFGVLGLGCFFVEPLPLEELEFEQLHSATHIKIMDWLYVVLSAISWITICSCVLFSFWGLFNILDKRPQIIITENGIWDKNTGQNEIKWEEILNATLFEVFTNQSVVLAFDDAFIIKKNKHAWAKKIKQKIGHQGLFLHTGIIKIDEVTLANFINELRKASIEERRELIKSFKVDSPNFSILDFRNLFIYFLISILLVSLTLVSLTLSSFTTLGIFLCIAFIAVIIQMWPSKKLLTIKKYASIVNILWFINMALSLSIIGISDKIVKGIGNKLEIKIEAYTKQNRILPLKIDSITKTLELNFLERYFADRIEYKRYSDYSCLVISKAPVYKIILEKPKPRSHRPKDESEQNH